MMISLQWVQGNISLCKTKLSNRKRHIKYNLIALYSTTEGAGLFFSDKNEKPVYKHVKVRGRITIYAIRLCRVKKLIETTQVKSFSTDTAKIVVLNRTPTSSP